MTPSLENKLCSRLHWHLTQKWKSEMVYKHTVFIQGMKAFIPFPHRYTYLHTRIFHFAWQQNSFTTFILSGKIMHSLNEKLRKFSYRLTYQLTDRQRNTKTSSQETCLTGRQWPTEVVAVSHLGLAIPSTQDRELYN